LSERLRIPEIVVGLTLVAFGTSLPELVINVLASVRGEGGITLGNIVGSNIANILLILGVSALISPISRHALLMRREIPLNLLLVILLALFLFRISEGTISRSEGFVFLVIFAAYILMTFAKYHDDAPQGTKDVESLRSSLLKVAFGSVALGLGANWTLEGAVALAHHLGISKTFVGLFVLAVGTSLPELITSAMAALRGNPYIAIGNVSGSNIFNVAMILGLSATIRPVRIPERAIFDVAFLLVATLLFLFFTMISRGRLLGRRRGILLLVLYLLYVAVSYRLEISGDVSGLIYSLREGLPTLP